jgi:hypothetical protein
VFGTIFDYNQTLLIGWVKIRKLGAASESDEDDPVVEKELDSPGFVCPANLRAATRLLISFFQHQLPGGVSSKACKLQY